MANSNKSQIEKLLELKQLFEQGILTKEEMEVEKARILSAPRQKSDVPISELPPVTSPEPIATVTNEEVTKSHFNKIVLGIASVAVVIFVIYVGFYLLSRQEPAVAPVEDLEMSQIPNSKLDRDNAVTNVDDGLKDAFERKYNSASLVKHTTGFNYPDFFESTTCFVDDVPGDVEIYYWEDVKICYWPFLGNWSTLDEFPNEGTYISPTDKVKNVVYTATKKGIFSGYTDKGNIYYLKRKIIPDEVPHGKVLVLIHPSSYKGNATDRLTKIVANW